MPAGDFSVFVYVAIEWPSFFKLNTKDYFNNLLFDLEFNWYGERVCNHFREHHEMFIWYSDGNGIYSVTVSHAFFSMKHFLFGWDLVFGVLSRRLEFTSVLLIIYVFCTSEWNIHANWKWHLIEQMNYKYRNYEKNKQTKSKWIRAQQLNDASFTEDSQTNLKHSLAVVPNFVMSFNYKDKIDWIQDRQ